MNTQKVKVNNKKVFMATTAVFLLASSPFFVTDIIAKEKGNEQTIEVVTDNPTGLLSVSYKEDFESLLIQHKIEQHNLEQEKKIEEENIIEQERLMIEAQKLELKQKRENFYSIVKNQNVTGFDLRVSSGLTVEQANLILTGTGLEGLGQGFVDAEEKHGVNAYYLMAHAAWESSWGKSELAQTKNNLFGFTAYDASPTKSATQFKTKEDCIDIVAGYVKTHYLSENGKYSNGPDLSGMNVRYATDTNWSEGIGSVIESLVNKSLAISMDSL